MIEIYSFEYSDGTEHHYTTSDANKARELAQKLGLRWIANRYELADSEMVADYSEGSDEQ